MALKTPISKPFVCDYCNTGYSKEKTLLTHMCEQKRRALQKDEQRVRHGFYAFQRFYKLSTGAKKEKSYEEFCKSSYYSSFVKFGSFISNVKPLYPEKYIDWVVTSSVKLDHWCKDELYEKYVLELIMKEHATTALERSVNTMVSWAEENRMEWNCYFKNVSANRAVWHIKDGKISPWLILNCRSGKELLATFNDEQLNMIYHIVNPEHWAIKFKRHPKDIELIKQIVKESKI